MNNYNELVDIISICEYRPESISTKIERLFKYFNSNFSINETVVDVPDYLVIYDNNDTIIIYRYNNDTNKYHKLYSINLYLSRINGESFYDIIHKIKEKFEQSIDS